MTKKRKATGTLGCLLENVDEEQLELCRQRMIIGAQISDMLEEKGITLDEFASSIGIHKEEILEWIQGDRKISQCTFNKILDKLNEGYRKL